MTILDRVLGSERDQLRLLALGGILAWAPLPWGSYAPWSLNLLAVLLCALGAWHLAVLALTGAPLRPATRASGVPLFFLAMAALWQWTQSATVSVSPQQTREFALLATGYLCAALLVTELVHTRRRLVACVWFLLGIAALEAAYGVAVVFSGDPYTLFDGRAVQPYAASGTFFNRNHFAAFLNLALALGVGLMVAQLGDPARSWREFVRQLIDVFLSGKAGLRLVLVILVIGLVVSRSRMGNLGFFAALGVAAAATALVQRRVSGGMTFFLGSIVVLDVFFVGAYFGVDQVADRITETAQGRARDERGDVFAALLPMVAQSLPFGSGAGTFMLTFPAFRTADISALYRNAHNDYAQVLIETGLPGACALLGFYLSTVWRGVRLIADRGRFWRGFGFGTVMVAVYFPLHALVEFNLYIPAVALFMVVGLSLLGCVAPALAAEPDESRESGRRRRRSSRPA